MKKFLRLEKPAELFEDWPAKYDVFSWLEYVLTIPNPIFLLTTLKDNGNVNACLHSWGLLVGNSANFSALLYIHKHMHSHALIHSRREWVMNYPSVNHWPQAFATIGTGSEEDELAAAGFSIQPSRTIATPGIAQCNINIECKLAWHQPLAETDYGEVVVGRVAGVHLDSKAMVVEPEQRLSNLALMYNVRGTVNPETLEGYGPNTLGLVTGVKKIFPDQYFDKNGLK